MKFVFVFIQYVLIYSYIELFFNAMARFFGWYDKLRDGNDEIGYKKRSKWTMEGYHSLWVSLLGGLAGIILYTIQLYVHVLWFYPLVGLAGIIIITIIEFLFGLLFNKVLKLNLWDYSNEPFNVLGQISLLRCIAWLLASTGILGYNWILIYKVFS